jgi:hypothetical protein
MTMSLGIYIIGIIVRTSRTKDAQEMMEQASGRWFSFSLSPDSVILLEKKGVTEHIGGLPSIDNPTRLADLLRELEDAGEVRVPRTHKYE